MASSDTQEHLRLWTKLANLYLEGRPGDALEIATEMEAITPHRRSFNAHIRACLLCAEGRETEALDLMKEIVAEGKWWPDKQLDDPDLEPIRELPEFSTLAREMASLRTAAQQVRADPKMEAFPSSGPARATIVALHMYGTTAAETAIPWRAATDAGANVLVIESSQHDADGNPVWDDPEIYERDVRLALERGKEVGDATDPLVFGGASQGAGVAMRLALSGSAGNAVGFIAVVGTAEPSGVDSFLEAAVSRGVRGVMIAGADDRLPLQWQKAARDALVERGIPIHFEEMPGVGHWYPDDFDERLRRALDFLLSP